MFTFTTENLLNDLSRVSIVDQTTDKSIPTDGKGFKLKGQNTFILSHMSPVWKAAGQAAVKQVVQFAVPAITAGLYRLQLHLTLSGSADADYSRWAYDYGKPVDVELNLAAGATLASVAASLQAYFNKYNAPDAQKGILVAAVSTNLQITAKNEYVRIAPTSEFQKFNETTQEFEKFNTAFTVTTPGNQGFATAWDLLKNFRVPTQEATYFTAEGQDERPIAGTLYNQYTFRYEAARNITGTGVLGEIARSVTTHVIYVLSTIAGSFETLLTGAGATIVVASTDPQTPVDDEQGNDTPIVP